MTRTRQRYRCVRSDGGRDHTFTERLPRHQPMPDPTRGGAIVCPECERPVTARDGQPAPRKHSYTAREIARALVEVGKGVSYRAAGERLRDESRVRRLNDRGKENWSLVGDSVEVFAPAIAGELLPAVWEDGVLLDSLPFSVRRRRNVLNGQLVTGGGATYTILIGACWSARFGWRIYDIEAVGGRPNANTWTRFMARLIGWPSHTCTDEDGTLLSAIEQHWPQAKRRIAWDHLQYQLSEAKLSQLARIKRHNEYDIVYQTGREALKSRRHWLNFLYATRIEGQRVRRRRVGHITYDLRRWILAHRKIVREQWAAAPYFPDRNAPIEQFAAQIRGQLRQRHAMFTNKLRTDRLLQLMALHQNKQDRLDNYERIIRRVLVNRRGWSEQRHVVLASPRLRP